MSEKLSTKTRAEKEDAEVERLVRPNPKIKPPRRDLRRNIVKTEDDPDNEKDKDQSMNYKDIGGSSGVSLTNIFDLALKYAKDNEPRVKVRTKDTDKVVMVTKETLKADPGKYEVIKDVPVPTKKLDPNKYQDIKDPSKKLDPSKYHDIKDDSTKEPEKSDDKLKSEQPKPTALPSEGEQSATLQQEAKANPQLKTVIDALTNKESPLYFMAVNEKDGNPNLPVNRVFPGWNHPTIQTIGQLAKILATPPSTPVAPTPAATPEAKPKKKKTKDAPQAQPTTPAQDAAQPAAPAQAKPVYKPPPQEDPKDRAFRDQTTALIKQNPQLGEALKGLTQSKSQVSQDAKANPDMSANEYFAGVLNGAKLPEGVNTLKDLQRVLSLPKNAPKTQQPAPQPAQPAAQTPANGKLDPNKFTQIQDDPKALKPSKYDSIQDGVKNTKLDPTKYDAIQDPGKALAQPTTPQAPAQPAVAPQTPATPAKGKATPPPIPKAEDKYDRLNRNGIHEIIKKFKANPEVAQAFKAITDENSPIHQKLLEDPDTSINVVLHDLSKKFPDIRKMIPEDLQTLGDLSKAMALPPPKAEKKPKDKGKDQAQVPQREITPAEKNQATNLIIHSFPTDIASHLLRLQPPLHPDEVHKLVNDHSVAKSVPLNTPADVQNLVNKVSGFYSLDPSKVKAPKTIEVGGLETPFDKASPEDQAKALREHQIKTVSLSLAAHGALTDKFKSQGLPNSLGSTLSTFMLAAPSTEHQDDKEARVKQLSEKTFFDSLAEVSTRKDKPLSTGARKSILKQLPAGAQQIATSYFQAKDYQEARNRFLSEDSPEQITEHANPKDILNGLKKAEKFFQEKSESYSKGMTDNNPAQLFREKVIKHLTDLSPKKAEAVQNGLDEHDNKSYDEAMKKFQKQTKPIQKQMKQVQKDYKKDYANYTKALKKGEDPDPPMSLQERYDKTVGTELPNEPKKPAKYDAMRKTPDDLAQTANSMFDRHNSRLAAHSSYLTGRMMGDRSKSAVYWGIDPNEGYDKLLDYDADYEAILKMAETQLDSSQSWKVAANKSAHLKQALDFALRQAEIKNLHPTVYEMLLSKLSGGKRLAAENNVSVAPVNSLRNEAMSSKITTTPEKINAVLARLDRMASIVQENHEKWGMKFAAAKDLTNEIDKIADTLELATYGEDSLLNRQASVMKIAEVLESDSDESYMNAFESTTEPHQIDADEAGYMNLFKDDQSSALLHGKTVAGKALLPNH